MNLRECQPPKSRTNFLNMETGATPVPRHHSGQELRPVGEFYLRSSASICSFKISMTGGQTPFLAERSPRFFSGNVHQTRLRSLGRREDGQEHKALAKRIVRSMHFAFWNQNHFARPENARVLADPLLGAARQDVDDLLARRVGVKRMRAPGLHVRANQEQLLVRNDVRPAKPLLQRPRREEV